MRRKKARKKERKEKKRKEKKERKKGGKAKRKERRRLKSKLQKIQITNIYIYIQAVLFVKRSSAQLKPKNRNLKNRGMEVGKVFY